MLAAFCKAYEQWDPVRQHLFAGIIVVCLMVLTILGAMWLLFLWRSFWEYVAIMLHGWPDGWAETKIKQIAPVCNSDDADRGNGECYNEDNRTGKCLRPGGCRTTGECERTIEMIDAGNEPGPSLRVVRPPDDKKRCRHPLNNGGDCMNKDRDCRSTSECNATIELWRKPE